MLEVHIAYLEATKWYNIHVKHIIAVILGLLCLIGIYFFVQYNSQPLSFNTQPPSITPTPSRTIVQGKSQKILFVPYWGLTSQQLPTNYDQLIYFGITPTMQGVDTQEDGYKDLSLFTKRVGTGKTLLTIRMIDPSVNAKVLQDKNLQNTIISDSLQIAQKYGFSGVVLDFEYNALAFDSVIKSISTFSTNFAKATHATNLTYYQSVYGDTFYRLRPYDVEALAKNADGIIILAYDFHKANGDAGPNFPLSGKDTDGYDLKAMVDDFAKKMPTQKLIIAFGLYGYDWQIDRNGHSQGPATPLSLIQIQQKFLNKCLFAQCVIKRDPVSSETEVTYTDISKNKHIVWFENMASVAQKSQYLRSQGINAIALWAYSYF